VCGFSGATRGKNRTQTIGKYQAAVRPELVEGQAKARLSDAEQRCSRLKGV
jgi:hypothetical protein